MVTCIVGINWGDEGKGRVADLLSRDMDIVCRCQGTSEARHTVVNERGSFMLNQLPSGILYGGVCCIMGDGMYIQPDRLDEEITRLRDAGVYISPENLKISRRAALVLPGLTATQMRLLLETRDRLSLVEVELLTGRTHQIRASFADMGHPLLGDGKYGVGSVNRRYGEAQQALYSYRLRFDFPTDAGILNYLRGREFIADEVPFRRKYFG